MPLPRAAEKADEQLLLVRDAIEEEEPGRRDVRGKAVQRTAQDSAPARTTSMRRLCAFVPFAGPVCLQSPDVEFLLLEVLAAGEGDVSVALPGADAGRGLHFGRVLALAERHAPGLGCSRWPSPPSSGQGASPLSFVGFLKMF